MRTMKRNGHKRDYAAEMTFDRKTRAVAPAGRPGFLGWLRRTRRRPPRTFWELDPASGEWRLL